MFFSKQLQGAQQCYSATELETLASVSTVEHFSYYLYGRQFKAFTDHKPLVHLMTSDRLNPRLRRMAFKLQHWMVAIEYLPGKDNTMADALSREERPRAVTPVVHHKPDVSLAAEYVEAGAPREREERREENKGCVGVATPT